MALRSELLRQLRQQRKTLLCGRAARDGRRQVRVTGVNCAGDLDRSAVSFSRAAWLGVGHEPEP
jgi:hypothetical protein